MNGLLQVAEATWRRVYRDDASRPLKEERQTALARVIFGDDKSMSATDRAVTRTKADITSLL